MKHLKKFNKVFEAKLNPIEEYIQEFLDLGFVLDKNDYSGVSNLNLTSTDLNDDILTEIFNEYLSLIGRLKENYKLQSYSISFDESGVSISITREVKSIESEVEMTEPQKKAYDSVVASLKEGERLEPYRIGERFIIFDKITGISGTFMWITIYSDGRVSLPILRGQKGQRTIELPFTEQDIKWFKRILWVDNHYTPENREEFDLLHSKSQQELREIYK